MSTEYNILMGEYADYDKELFFGPVEDQVFTEFPNLYCSLAHLFTQLGLFSSNSQARKAGWGKEVPQGYSEYTIGKLRTKIYILNPDVLPC